MSKKITKPWKGKKKDEENYIEATKGMYTPKKLLSNLSKSMGKDPDSLYPEKADKIFKINDLVDLRLINNKTYIYINNARFVQCFNVLLNVEPSLFRSRVNIKNMDEASQLLGSRYSSWFTKISPEETFMAHCSNIQAFFENELNTDLLHSDVAFPLLKKLVQVGYKPAERNFTAEIVKRYNEGTWKSREFLRLEGYLDYLNKEEKKALKKDKKFKTSKEFLLPPIADKDIGRKFFERDFRILELSQVEKIRVFEYDDIESEFVEILKKFPLKKLLDSDKLLLFDDPDRDEVWIWHGANTTAQMKYYAKISLSTFREKENIGMKIIPVDEGIEPVEFTKMMMSGESLDYQEVLQGLDLLDPSYREKLLYLMGIKINFISVDKGIIKIKTVMKEESVNELTIHRKYLPEMFDADLLKISNTDGYPTFRPGVILCFELKGISTIVYGHVLKFFQPK